MNRCRVARGLSCVLATLVLCLSGALVRAQSPDSAAPAGAAPSTEQRSEAVTQVVLGILSYAQWPIEPAEINLCVVAPTQYADDLLQQSTMQASGRNIRIRRVAMDSPSVSTECDVVYTGVMTDQENQQLFSRLAGHPVLSIAEHNDQCAVGSMFCLNVTDTPVSFQINLDSVARSGVRIHPRVLRLAHKAGRP
jgi:hypothetical protein